MGGVADNPKGKSRQKREVDASQKATYYEIPDSERCARFAQDRGCSHSHRCADCWFDAGLRPVEQAEVKSPPPGWIRMDIAVEDAISLIAGLVHKRQAARQRDGFPGRPITAYPTGRNTPEPFSNRAFELRPGAQRGHTPNFRCDDFDFSARWAGHIGYCGYQNREIKGKQLIEMVQLCLLSLTEAR